MKRIKNVLAALTALAMIVPNSSMAVLAEETETPEVETEKYTVSVKGDAADYVVIMVGGNQDIISDGDEIGSGTQALEIQDSFGEAIGAEVKITVGQGETVTYTLDEEGIKQNIVVSGNVVIEVNLPSEEQDEEYTITINDNAASASTDSAVNAVHVYKAKTEDDDYASGTKLPKGSEISIYVWNLATPVNLTVVHNGQKVIDKDYAIHNVGLNDAETFDIKLEGDLIVTTTVIEEEEGFKLHINGDSLGWVYLEYNDIHEGAALAEGETDFEIYSDDKPVSVIVKIGDEVVEEFELEGGFDSKEITVDVTADM